MKYAFFNITISAILVLLTSCESNINIDSIDRTLLEKEKNLDEQAIRHAVMTSTNINPDSIIPKLENAWKMSSNQSGMVANNSIVRIAIAHQLMEHESGYYKECYEFITNSVNSKEDDVATSAISALSSAKGSDSLALLFKYAKDSRHSRVMVSLKAIEDRRLLAKYNTIRADEIPFISEQSDMLCKDAGTHAWYVEFCKKR
jgi:hypothetical protein